jgi:hypothetical protein
MALREIDFSAESKSNLGKVAHLLDLSSGWYKQWYMSLRLEEEVHRALRYGRSLSLISITLCREGGSGRGAGHRLPGLLTAIASQNLRASDLPGLGDRNEYLILLPETDHQGAEIVAGRVTERLAGFSPVAGIAVLPRHGKTVADLLGYARRATTGGQRGPRAV